MSVFTDVHASFIAVIFYFWNSNANINNNNNLYCALDTKSVKTLKGNNNCEKKRVPSHSAKARANRAEWLGHAKKVRQRKEAKIKRFQRKIKNASILLADR